jgi:hypothetical protein
MKWPDVLLALVRCEFKARYTGLGGCRLSAKGALPVVLLTIVVITIWGTVTRAATTTVRAELVHSFCCERSQQSFGGAGGTGSIQTNQRLALANLKFRPQYIPIAYFAAG